MENINRIFCDVYADLEHGCLDLCGAAEDAVKAYADDMQSILLLDPEGRDGWQEIIDQLNAVRRIWLYLTHTEGALEEAPACGEAEIRFMKSFTRAASGRQDPVSLYYRDRSEGISGRPEAAAPAEDEEPLTALERVSGRRQAKRPAEEPKAEKPKRHVTGRGIRKGILTAILCLMILAVFAGIAWLLLR